jgi:hypothetical protein
VNDLRRRVLLFEQADPTLPVDTFKAHRIREAFGFGASTYMAHLMRALGDREAAAIAPELVAARAAQVARLRHLDELVTAQPSTWPQGEDRVRF